MIYNMTGHKLSIFYTFTFYIQENYDVYLHLGKMVYVISIFFALAASQARREWSVLTLGFHYS